tara:strand:- start:150 stop:260 length:111 start_codon:yes stop_codon:yes gene_type:complete
MTQSRRDDARDRYRIFRIVSITVKQTRAAKDRADAL